MKEVLLYLVEHTDAMDTCEGILQWWLAAGAQYPQEQAQAVLNELVERGWLVARGSIDRFRLYSLNKERMQEVLKSLSEQNAADRT